MRDTEELSVVPARIGDYHIIDLLGEGGMGLVFLGRDELLARDVAIKVVQPGRLTENGLRRFDSEAKAMARVQHENVVAIYALGDHQGNPFIAMEYIPGETVETLIAHQRLSLDRALSVIDQMCRGVQAIHDSGTVHGDLKPSNLLVGPAFRVAVADLGFARHVRDGSDDNLIIGTPEYIAPEIVLGTELTTELRKRADIYSLGMVAYELLAGARPFEGASPTRLMLMQVNEDPEPPSRQRKGLSRAFDAPILAALAKDPADRVHSAQAFRESLAKAREIAAESPTGQRFIALDDDPDFLALLATCLEESFPDAELVLCETGAQARAAIEEPFTLALLDLHLPDDDAGELTKLMRDKAPVLVITGSGSAADWQRLQALGAKGFLVKPLDPYALSAAVRRLTSRPSMMPPAR